MSKIDLLNQQWIDLVFEGKNEAYGAYQMRRDTSNRNLLSVLYLFAGIVLLVGLFIGFGAASEAIRSASAEHETSVELEAAEEEEVEEEEEDEIIYELQPQEELVAQETLMNSEKFTAFEMDDEVKPEETSKTQDEMAQSDVAVAAVTFDQGSDEGQQVLQLNQKVVDEVPDETATKVFEVVEQMPTFPGGDAALMSFLSKNIKYPVIAEENGIQGRVVATFVVERDGSITDVKVIKSVDPSLDKEAVRVLKTMPKWIPGKQNGSAVRVKYTVPVTFRLQ